MSPTALSFFAGTFAVLFAPSLWAQQPAAGPAALLGQGAASIQFAAPPAEAPAEATPAERGLLGRQAGVRLRLEADDRASRSKDVAARALLGR